MKNTKLIFALIFMLFSNLMITFYLRKENQQKEKQFIKETARKMTESNLQGVIRN